MNDEKYEVTELTPGQEAQVIDGVMERGRCLIVTEFCEPTGGIQDALTFLFAAEASMTVVMHSAILSAAEKVAAARLADIVRIRARDEVLAQLREIGALALTGAG